MVNMSPERQAMSPERQAMSPELVTMSSNMNGENMATSNTTVINVSSEMVRPTSAMASENMENMVTINGSTPFSPVNVQNNTSDYTSADTAGASKPMAVVQTLALPSAAASGSTLTNISVNQNTTDASAAANGDLDKSTNTSLEQNATAAPSAAASGSLSLMSSASSASSAEEEVRMLSEAAEECFDGYGDNQDVECDEGWAALPIIMYNYHFKKILEVSFWFVSFI